MYIYRFRVYIVVIDIMQFVHLVPVLHTGLART